MRTEAVARGAGAERNTGPEAEREPGDATWPLLTVSGTKRELYGEDLYFRECWDDLRAVHGAGTARELGPLGLLSFKCDGIAARRPGRTFDYLAAQGFAIVGSARIRQTRHSMRELWRYNWHVYTTDRLALMTLMHTVGPSVLLIVRDERHDPAVPGSVRLADLKGSADPAARGPEHLRTVLDPPSKIINFVHVADEPADLVREVGIFLDRPQRRALWAQVAAGDVDESTRAARREAALVQEECPSSDFDLGNALERLRPKVGDAAADRLAASAAGGERLPWDTLCDLAEPDAVDIWDFVTVATAVLDADRTAPADLLPPSSAAEWRAHAAESAA